jgi:hypothetical protein
MNPRTIYLVTGYLSIGVGILAALSIYRSHFLMYGMGLAFIGMMSGTVNVFLNERHRFDEEKFPKGYLGMFLSSLPVLFMIFLKYNSGR